jgi:hypothetical protein
MEVMEERVWERMSEEAMISKKYGLLEKNRKNVMKLVLVWVVIAGGRRLLR